MKYASVCLLASVMIVLVAFAPQSSGQTAENLLLITYDGLRWQEVFGGADARLLDPESGATKNLQSTKERFWRESPTERRERLLPFFWNTIAREGQIYGDAQVGSLSAVTNGRLFSYPGYNELLTGAPDDRIDSNDKRNNPNINVLEWINGLPGFTGRVVAFSSWDVFPYIINSKRSGVPVNAGWVPITESVDPERARSLNELADEMPHYWSNVRFDAFTYNGTVEYIKKHKPRVVYVAFGETDDWAHDGRYDLYLEAARRTDDHIRRLWTLMQSMPEYSGKTALLMSTDHGRGDTVKDWTGHGSKVEGCERIWFAMMGRGIPAKGIVEGVATTQSQFAATAASLIGLEFAPQGQTVAPAIRP